MKIPAIVLLLSIFMLPSAHAARQGSIIVGHWRSTSIVDAPQSGIPPITSYELVLLDNGKFAWHIEYVVREMKNKRKQKRQVSKSRKQGTWKMAGRELTLISNVVKALKNQPSVFAVTIKGNSITLTSEGGKRIIQLARQKADLSKTDISADAKTVYDVGLVSFAHLNFIHSCCDSDSCCATKGCCDAYACLQLSCKSSPMNKKGASKLNTGSRSRNREGSGHR